MCSNFSFNPDAREASHLGQSSVTARRLAWSLGPDS